MNFSKARALYRCGMTPLVRSASHPQWARLPPSNCFYYKSPRHRTSNVLSVLFTIDRSVYACFVSDLGLCVCLSVSVCVCVSVTTLCRNTSIKAPMLLAAGSYRSTNWPSSAPHTAARIYQLVSSYCTKAFFWKQGLTNWCSHCTKVFF